MRILAIENKPTTEHGGSERSYFDVLTGLRARGHEIVLLYEEPGNLLNDYIQCGVSTVQTTLTLLLRKGSRWRDFTRLLQASRVVSEKGPFDVIYVNYTHALPLAILMKLRSQTPVVCHIRLVYDGLTRQILWCSRLVEKFIVINNKMKPSFEKVFHARNKVDVVYNGIDVPDRLPTTKIYIPLSEVRLLYLGRLAPEKGVVEMILAFARAIEGGFKGTLQITGPEVASYSGNYREEMIEAISRCNINHLVKLSPPVRDPLQYIADFDLLVFPSKWDEPFGRTIPESILAGTPVLARNVGMISEIMADNPEFVFDGDEDLKRKMLEFYHGTLKFDIHAARLSIKEKFHKDHMIRGVEKVLETVCRKK